GAAWTASVSDIVVQVKGTAMCVGGPSILEIATGEKTSLDELGGWELHAKVTGQVDLFAEDDKECLALVRKALGYFSRRKESTPIPRDPTPSSDVAALVPTDPRAVYDMHKVIDAICDEGSVF